MPRPVIIFDVETTGFSPAAGHRVVEIGAVRLSGGAVGDEFSTLVNPGCKMPQQAQRVHGISDDMLRGQPSPNVAFADFQTFIRGALLVAHNVRFDRAFLASEYARLKIPLNNRFACTLKLSQRKLPLLPNHRLQTVARHLLGGLPGGRQSHRALDDARLVAKVWVELGGG